MYVNELKITKKGGNVFDQFYQKTVLTQSAKAMQYLAVLMVNFRRKLIRPVAAQHR